MSEAVWRKSRHSDDKGGACIELAPLTEGVGVRDSRDPDGPHLILGPTTFRSLLNRLKQR